MKTLTLFPSYSLCSLINLALDIDVGGIKSMTSTKMSTPTIPNKYMSLTSYEITTHIHRSSYTVLIYYIMYIRNLQV